MALLSMIIVVAFVAAISLAVARLGLAFTLSVAGGAAQLHSDHVARDSLH